MSTNNKKKTKNGLRLLRTIFSIAGCGNRSHSNHVVLHDLPIHPKSPSRYHHNDVVSSPTFSLSLHRPNHNNDDTSMAAPPSATPPRSAACSESSKLGESVAVVKESKDPYLDFRHSMLQMIFEKEMLAQEDLQELLACFLRLNLPCHHDDIIRAFSEIWGAVMSPAAPSLPSGSPNFRLYS